VTRSLRLRLLLVVVALATAAAVWLAASVQERATSGDARRISSADRVYGAMLSLEAGTSTYLLAPEEEHLHLIEDGRQAFERAVEDARAAAKSDGAAVRDIDELGAVHARWARISERQIAAARRGDSIDKDGVEQRHLLVDDFVKAQRDLVAHVREDAAADRRGGTRDLIILSLLLSGLVGSLGAWLLGRSDRVEASRLDAERRQRESQTDFAETLQLVQSEADAHALLARHLELSLPGASAVVMKRNNSENRLEPTTELPGDDPGLVERLEHAEPKQCIANRIGRGYGRRPGEQQLLRCELCGDIASESTCSPLLVGGEVIGSVLVTQHGGGTAERERIADSVNQAAPVLANLRTLAIAETRAATDSLTGLPNRRSAQDTLKRMVAQAGRQLAPLAAIAMDLDQFKRVNDCFGHEKGDDVLAAVGRLLAEAVRESDFAARQGGEEFLLLLPETGREGAVQLAEKLRAAVGRTELPGVDTAVSASFGVAVYPEDAVDAETLLRKADRALYAAKEGGRNRIEVVSAPTPPAPIAG
jgi:diguanylate cyclase (GGDEF)-like protein